MQTLLLFAQLEEFDSLILGIQFGVKLIARLPNGVASLPPKVSLQTERQRRAV